MLLRLLFLPVLALLLSACDIPGMGPDPRIAQREADSKAIGGACRHALRGIEECYQLTPQALKTAVFEGWRGMDQYMRDNKIEGQPTPAVDGAAMVEQKKPAPVETKPAPSGKKAS